MEDLYGIYLLLDDLTAINLIQIYKQKQIKQNKTHTHKINK